MAIPQQGSFLQFFHSFSRQFFGVLTLKEMLPYFVFYQYLAVFSHFSLEWLNDAFFGKEMTVGLGLGLFCDAFSNLDMDVYLSVYLESWNRRTSTSLSDSFHFLLVKRVLKYTWRRTSAPLNYECFHGHQVKLKQVHFSRAPRAKRASGAPWLNKSTHPRKFGNHLTDRPSVRTTGIPMFTLTLSSYFGSSGES